MSLPVTVRPRARRDFVNIAARLAREDRRAAARFTTAFNQALADVQANPHLGIPYEDAPPDLASLRLKPVGRFRKYLIVYQASEAAITVERVVHASQDLDRILGE